MNCYAFTFGYLRWQDLVDLIYKRIHFQSDIQPREQAICAILGM